MAFRRASRAAASIHSQCGSCSGKRPRWRKLVSRHSTVTPSTLQRPGLRHRLVLAPAPALAVLLVAAALERRIGPSHTPASSAGRHMACGSGRSTVNGPKRSSLRPLPLSSERVVGKARRGEHAQGRHRARAVLHASLISWVEHHAHGLPAAASAQHYTRSPPRANDACSPRPGGARLFASAPVWAEAAAAGDAARSRQRGRGPCSALCGDLDAVRPAAGESSRAGLSRLGMPATGAPHGLSLSSNCKRRTSRALWRTRIMMVSEAVTRK